jgi:hypothetical protein
MVREKRSGRESSEQSLVLKRITLFMFVYKLALEPSLRKEQAKAVTDRSIDGDCRGGREYEWF